MTYNDLLSKAVKTLSAAGVQDAVFDSQQLLLYVMNTDLTGFFLKKANTVSASQAAFFEKCLLRRSMGEPLQYIVGKWDFFRSTFYVGNGVLIPRPETEELVSMCIDIIKADNYKYIFDLCAGTGCIGISIASFCPNTQVFLFEHYPLAYAYALKNISEHKLNNVKLIQCDVLAQTAGELPAPDMIISNPPYISSREIPALQKELEFEPLSALDGGEDGLKFYRAIAEKWLPLLNSGGAAAVECGEEQSERISEIFSDCLSCRREKDMYGKNRFVIGKSKR